MEHDDFLELFYLNLKVQLGNDEFVDSIEELVNENKFTKKNYMNLIKEEYHE